MIPALTFRLNHQYYALHIDDVVEVAAMVELLELPDAPPEVLGFANRHGNALPLLDLRLIFNQPANPVDTMTLFIVVSYEEQLAGLVVDEVFQVMYADHVQSVPSSRQYIRGIIQDDKGQMLQLVALPTLYDRYIPRSRRTERVDE